VQSRRAASVRVRTAGALIEDLEDEAVETNNRAAGERVIIKSKNSKSRAKFEGQRKLN
jgi:hypothetical protein